MRWKTFPYRFTVAALVLFMSLSYGSLQSTPNEEQATYAKSSSPTSETPLPGFKPGSAPEIDLPDPFLENSTPTPGSSPQAPEAAVVVTPGKKLAPPLLLLLGDEVIVSAAITAQPTTGVVPLTVKLSAAAVGGTPPYSFAWDLDGDGTADDTRQSFNTLFLQPGTQRVFLTVRDSTDSAAYDTVWITVLSPPSALASATPTGGKVPLTVSFNAKAIDPDGKIVRYRWDFTSDGTYDFTSPTSPATTHTYAKNGSYKATLEVMDNSGLKGTDTVTITVGDPPVAAASANPTKGTAPLGVDFIGTGSDSDGKIVRYQWDFDGNGIYDWSSQSGGNTTHIYASSGSFNATLRVTDNSGLTDTASVFISVSGAPVSLPGAFPTSGEVPLKVTFFANGQDLDGTAQYFYWDYDGDGIYDIFLDASANTNYTFTKAGTYQATLKVIDNEGLEGTASIPITVTDPNPQGLPTAIAGAFPTNGGAPLMVALNGRGTAPNGKIVKYEWDFDGDGKYDWEEAAVPGGELGVPLTVPYRNAPIFADIDGDGDLDALIGNIDGTIFLYRNDGTKKVPKWTPAGTLTDINGKTVSADSSNSRPALGDLDGDGDLDLLIGSSSGSIIYYRNDGTKTAPKWSPMGTLADAGGATVYVIYDSTPTLADIDGDGDLDLLIGEYYGNIIHYRNDGTKNAPKWTRVGSLTDSGGNPIAAGYNVGPTFADLDGDGKLDLVVGEWYGTLTHYRNTGTQGSPAWTRVGLLSDAAGAALDAGYTSKPVFADLDGDGDLDLFSGEYYGAIVYFRNNGNATTPSWQLVSRRYATVSVKTYAHPALADGDGDGDLDLFIGEGGGTVLHYRNGGTPKSPVWNFVGPLTDKDGVVINAGTQSSPSEANPALADVDGDGDPDLFIGEGYYSGRILYFENIGTKTSPKWESKGPLVDASGNVINVGYNATPTFFDIDGDGDLDLFVGEYYGRIIFYRNDGTPNLPKWTQTGALSDSLGNTIDVGSNSSPALADLDRDGSPDLVIGDYYGALTCYRNTGDSTAPVWNLLASCDFGSINVGYYSAPAFGDIDGDGDYDLFVGNSLGYMKFYPTTGYTKHLYETEKNYQATLRVTDDGGLTDTDLVTIRVLPSGSPTAQAAAKPTTGSVPLTVSFDGKGIAPKGQITNYEWDFNGDGVYDWNSATSPKTTYTYSSVGSYNATLRVTDNTGKKAKDSVSINPTMGITTTRTGIFNPQNGEKAAICETLTDNAQVTVKIIDADGKLVRVLVNNASRNKAVSYCDDWNGADGADNPVRDGIYYYLIEYTVNGQTTTLDLRNTAEYREFTPSRSWSNTFNAYEEKFVEVNYPLSKPCEVSIYLWTRDYSLSDSIRRVRTLFLRDPQGAGQHKAVWDAIDDRGVAVKYGEYPVTLWAYELADNAVIVSGNRPVISDIGAEPNVFTTGYNPYSTRSNQQTTVSFSLSKKADVEVRITNGSGVVIKVATIKNQPSGAGTISWDGKDQSGNFVPPGGYTIALMAVDGTGSRSLRRYASVVLIE